MRTKYIIGVFICCIVYIFATSCQGETEIRKAQFFTNGKSLYANKCENCHGKQGEGLGQLYPPLNDSLFLKRNRSQLPCIIKHGLHQEIQVHNKKFDMAMPANTALTDQEIAYILTYVGNTFGNAMGLTSTEDVQKELSACR